MPSRKLDRSIRWLQDANFWLDDNGFYLLADMMYPVVYAITMVHAHVSR